MSPCLPKIAAALLLSAFAVHAQDAAPAKPDAAPAKTDGVPPKVETAAPKTEPVPPYDLKNRSKFADTAKGVRAPFWPIGWVKRVAGAAPQAPMQEAPKVLLDEKSFKVTSILLGTGTTPSLAVINGRAYSEGEFLRMPKGSALPNVRVRVQRINDGSVVLQNANQTMVAQLSRPELSNKKSEELLLDPDR